MTVIYEDTFNINEWFVIVNLALNIIIIWITPKIFTILEGIAYYIFGIVYGMFYDHTISVKPWDFYDVNDSSAYQLMDFISYVMYGGYSYFFLYVYEKMNIKGYLRLGYVLIWSCISLLLEWIGVQIGLFHFDKGYNMYWSFPIYIIAQSMLIIFYHISKRTLGSKKLHSS